MHRAGNRYSERERDGGEQGVRRESKDRRQPLKTRDMYKRWPRYRDSTDQPETSRPHEKAERANKEKREAPEMKTEKNRLKNKEKDE